MTIDTAKTALRELQAKQAAYGHAMALINYDGSTTAPKATAANRAQTMSILGAENYRLATGQETVELLEFLDAHRDELDAQEARCTELLLKGIRQLQKIPMDQYIELQKLMVEADALWHEAKDTNNWPIFAPVLEKVFDFHKRIAAWVAPEKDPYDYWLNEFEEGLTKEKCEVFFSTLRSRIVPLIEKVQAAPQLDNSMLSGDFPAWKQEKLAYWLMETIGLDLGHVGLATTEHPFTTSLGSHFDERITTKYHPDSFYPAMFSVIHEGGHALYDTGSADELAYTAADGGVSMGIHESQSRFYENILGRSRAFCSLVFPKLQELFPAEMEGHTAEDLYKAVNRSEPGLIRIESDELSYALHIMVRFEMEKRYFAGELAVADFPEAWNALYKEYLGVDVPDDSHGVLQDSHWSIGAIGYFPSYALGSAYGAQFLRKMRESVDVDGCIARGDFGPINEWNREHIWRHGSMLTPAEVFANATGEEFDPNVFCDYLEQKFGELYGF
ncbi:MAG: carboxypeptidase M32 [Oscillospiraceae bacterium]|nr:carboxypeptidase M32 [Oscillospiraceae bacterium]